MPQTKEIIEVTGNSQSRFVSRSNTIYLTFTSGTLRSGTGFNISIDTGKSTRNKLKFQTTFL